MKKRSQKREKWEKALLRARAWFHTGAFFALSTLIFILSTIAINANCFVAYVAWFPIAILVVFKLQALALAATAWCNYSWFKLWGQKERRYYEFF